MPNPGRHYRGTHHMDLTPEAEEAFEDPYPSVICGDDFEISDDIEDSPFYDDGGTLESDEDDE